MSNGPLVPTPTPTANDTPKETETVPAEYISAKELEKLPPEMKTVVSVMAAFIKSSTGPDAETTKIVAQTEMHGESCKLDGYKETLKSKDRQNERDHLFRNKRLNHDTARNMIFLFVCVIGIVAGLYLLVIKKEETLGSNILLASFLSMLGGGRFLSQKDRD